MTMLIQTHSNQFLKLGSPRLAILGWIRVVPYLLAALTHEFILVHAVYTCVLISYF